MKTPHQFRTGYDIESVRMPIAGIGPCKNFRRCKNYMTDLANGYCVECWDRGLDNNSRSIAGIKKREEQKEERRLKGLSLNRTSKFNTNMVETRGRHINNCTCEYHIKKGFD